MKICYLANARSIHTQRWVNYFADRGWEVDLITWHPPDSNAKFSSRMSIHKIIFPPHYIPRYGALLEIARLIKKIRPDVIHAHYISHFGILAGLYGRLFGFKPIVLTVWGSDVLIDPKGFKKSLVKYALERADLITCDADHMIQELISLGTNPKKITLSYFGTDIQKFSREQRSEQLRENPEIQYSFK